MRARNAGRNGAILPISQIVMIAASTVLHTRLCGNIVSSWMELSFFFIASILKLLSKYNPIGWDNKIRVGLFLTIYWETRWIQLILFLR
jgi:hypothetical protein